MKHKWHDEIVAWAGGQKVEECKAGIWYETDYPDFNAKGHEFRIKPQPKEPQYINVYGYLENKNITFRQQIGMPYIGKIKLEVQDD